MTQPVSPSVYTPRDDREVGSLTEALGKRAALHRDGTAYTFLTFGEPGTIHETPLTYGELDHRARCVAAGLLARVTAGDRALLLYPPGVDYLIAFFGCLYAGVIAVPVYPPRPNHHATRLQAIVADATPAIVLTSASIAATASAGLATDLGLAPGIPWLATDTDGLPEAYSGAWSPATAVGDSIAFLQYTSGSTASPRGVMVTHDNLLRNVRLMEAMLTFSERSIFVSWLPLYHDMGLIAGALLPLAVGARALLMSPLAFLQRPRRWLEAISTYRATTSGGPDFGYELVVRRVPPAQRAGLDLSSWTMAMDGSEPVRQKTLDRFVAAFAPNGFSPQALCPAYGLAEATLVVAGDHQGRRPRVQSVRRVDLERHRVVETTDDDPEGQAVVSCGAPAPGIEVSIVDPQTRLRVSDGAVGEIWVASPSIAAGYWQQPGPTADTFQARLDTGEGPYLRTGDLGFLHSGEVFVTGRLKDLIIIDGRNLYPGDLELTVQESVPSVRPGGVAAFSIDRDGAEKLVIAVEIEERAVLADTGRIAELVRAVRQSVADEHDVSVSQVLPLRPGALPRTSSGKLQRHACRTAALASGFAGLELV
jgi:acyl-CoA synthetase (AMP-forming)/AMP-acid ligase II